SGMVLYVSSSVGCLFFSSRRRHTSFSRDWSSDVCSSDLPEPTGAGTLDSTSRVSPTLTLDFTLISLTTEVVGWDGLPAAAPEARSEERRVGKACGGRWRGRGYYTGRHLRPLRQPGRA